MRPVSMELEAWPVDVQVAQPDFHWTTVDVVWTSSLGHIKLQPISGNWPCSRYSVTVDDISVLGSVAAAQVDPQIAGQLLVIALSLNSHEVAFTKPSSPWDVRVASEQIPPTETVTHTAHGEKRTVSRFIPSSVALAQTVATRLTNLREEDVRATLDKLVALDPFDGSPPPTTNEQNLRQAVQAYHLALCQNSRLSALEKFCIAVEKAVNRNCQNRKQELDGERLDVEVANLTDLTQAEAESVRTLNNRAKHAAKNHQDMQEFAAGVADLDARLRNAKRAADQVINACL
jgi:hypothetical protein